MVRIILYLLLFLEKKNKEWGWITIPEVFDSEAAPLNINTQPLSIITEPQSLMLPAGVELLAPVLRGYSFTSLITSLLLFQNLSSYANSSCFCSWKHSSYCCCRGVFKLKENFSPETTVFKTLIVSMPFERCVSTLLRSCSNFSWHWDKGLVCHLSSQQWSILISSLCPKLKHRYSSNKYVLSPVMC